MFHFVTGGVTPAALGADWITTVLDQNAFSWVNTPLASRLETISLVWLKDLFGLPESWAGSSRPAPRWRTIRRWPPHATGTASGTAPTSRRSGWRAAGGPGPDGRPPPPQRLEGVHMLGIGRSQSVRSCGDGAGRMDVDALARALEDLRGAPAIVAVTAGEPNAADIDPIARVADLAEEHGAWLHVDGAFGLFARTTRRQRTARRRGPRALRHRRRPQVAERPYDCGFAFVRDASLLPKAFAAGAAYLPPLDDPRPNLGYSSPEMSAAPARSPCRPRSARTAAAGTARWSSATSGLHARWATSWTRRPTSSCWRRSRSTSCASATRRRPWPATRRRLDRLNRELGQAVLDDGRVYVGTTVYDGRVAFRPAIVNWRTTEPDVRMIVDVIRELGERADRRLRLSRAAATMAACLGAPSGRHSRSSSRTRCRPNGAGEHWWMEVDGRELRLLEPEQGVLAGGGVHEGRPDRLLLQHRRHDPAVPARPAAHDEAHAERRRRASSSTRRTRRRTRRTGCRGARCRPPATTAGGGRPSTTSSTT